MSVPQSIAEAGMSMREHSLDTGQTSDRLPTHIPLDSGLPVADNRNLAKTEQKVSHILSGNVLFIAGCRATAFNRESESSSGRKCETGGEAVNGQL